MQKEKSEYRIEHCQSIWLDIIYKTLHEPIAGNTFFSRAQWTIYQVDYKLSYNTSLKKFLRVKIKQYQTAKMSSLKSALRI